MDYNGLTPIPTDVQRRVPTLFTPCLSLWNPLPGRLPRSPRVSPVTETSVGPGSKLGIVYVCQYVQTKNNQVPPKQS